PVTKGGAGPVVGEMLPGADESLLCRVLCQIRVPTHSVDHVDDPLSVTVDQFTKGPPVSLLSLGDQLEFGFC
ncbi:MAG: hypothetical protein GTN71_26775, partial [Anaerolineae bacterium]|nr:hypothetical protein [Anaerolineae bacterium]